MPGSYKILIATSSTFRVLDNDFISFRKSFKGVSEGARGFNKHLDFGFSGTRDEGLILISKLKSFFREKQISFERMYLVVDEPFPCVLEKEKLVEKEEHVIDQIQADIARHKSRFTQEKSRETYFSKKSNRLKKKVASAKKRMKDLKSKR